MATSKKTMTANTWVEISTVDCTFQVTSDHDIYVSKQAAIPTDLTTPYKLAEGKKVYGFVAGGEKLYGYSPSKTIIVAVDV